MTLFEVIALALAWWFIPQLWPLWLVLLIVFLVRR